MQRRQSPRMPWPSGAMGSPGPYRCWQQRSWESKEEFMVQRNLTLNIKLLSDLHIGTGTKFLEGLDWIERPDGYIYLSDQVAINDLVMQRGLADGRDERFVANKITGLSLQDL